MDPNHSFISNKSIAMSAFSRDGMLLAHASKQLKSDPDVVYVAVRNNVASFGYADHRLRGDPQFCVKCLETAKNHQITELASLMSTNVKRTREVITFMIDNKHWKWDYIYIGQRLKNKYETYEHFLYGNDNSAYIKGSV